MGVSNSSNNSNPNGALILDSKTQRVINWTFKAIPLIGTLGILTGDNGGVTISDPITGVYNFCK